jgi:hypothetical protein
MSGPITPITTAPAAFTGIVEKINEVIAANPPLEAGSGLMITRSKSNILINLKSNIKSSIENQIIPPWFLTGTIESGTAKISINPGLVNNFVPTIGGVSLGAFPRPTLTVTGSVGVIEIKATIDGAGIITAVIVQNVATATADTVTNKYKTIGGWTSASGAFTSVTSILNTNQTFYLCNGTAIWEA